MSRERGDQLVLYAPRDTEAKLPSMFGIQTLSLGTLVAPLGTESWKQGGAQRHSSTKQSNHFGTVLSWKERWVIKYVFQAEDQATLLRASWATSHLIDMAIAFSQGTLRHSVHSNDLHSIDCGQNSR